MRAELEKYKKIQLNDLIYILKMAYIIFKRSYIFMSFKFTHSKNKHSRAFVYVSLNKVIFGIHVKH